MFLYVFIVQADLFLSREVYKMSCFHEKLRDCRLSRKSSQKELADLLGISERGYRHYELGSREPDIEGLIALADFFDVSLDYLVGRSDNPEINTREKEPKQ